MWVWKKVALPVWLMVLLGKYHGEEKKKKAENGVEESNLFFFTSWSRTVAEIKCSVV